MTLLRKLLRRKRYQTYRGTCDVCGEPISLRHAPRDGLIDVSIEDDDRVCTWIRHIGGPRPECEIYSSRAWLDA